MSTTVELTQSQIDLANKEAIRRQTENEAKGLKGRNKAASTGKKALEFHKLGCIGEIAVASYMGLDSEVFTLDRPLRGSCDLPGNIEVKTRSKHDFDLLIQITDDPNKNFVLVTHDGKTTKIAGWIRGHDAMRREWIKEYVRGRPCYAVNQTKLRPIETLSIYTSSKGFGSQVFEAQIVECPDDPLDLILEFDPLVIERLGWQAGDTLVWEQTPDENQWIIRRIGDDCKKVAAKSDNSRVEENGKVER
jgi:hypothetical protein